MNATLLAGRARAGNFRPPANGELELLLAEIRACRRCVERPAGAPLPHEPRPVLQASASARLAIFSQAPGTRVHLSGRPFTDASGERLRDWLGVGPDIFYDATRIAVIPMGFCFPGQDDKGGDLPPRSECAPLWRARLTALLPRIETMVLVGAYAQKWHLGERAKATLSETVRTWRDVAPRFYPIPHPSWRNNAWLKRHPFFERELLPDLKRRVALLTSRPPR
ncbi:MAG: uracil-DNA glycosylase family protein [Parvularculaceae bacterium]|jgi:uracil-DNA glycosylase|nr:uracil-DNA glycosylase family protein [Parvularculaceae bacterium]